jgi:hypothetical protein
MRKDFDGLYGIERDRLQLEVRSGHLFLFPGLFRSIKEYQLPMTQVLSVIILDSLDATPMAILYETLSKNVYPGHTQTQL